MGGKTIEGSFNGSQQRVFLACQRTVAHLGYTVLHTDSGAGVISFNTGRSMKSWAGQDLSVTVLPHGTQCRVVIGGSLGKGGNPFGGGQIGAWGEKSSLSRKFLDTLAGLLPSVAEPAVPQAAAPAGLASELERLKALLDAGAISASEFDAAKARLLG